MFNLYRYLLLRLCLIYFGCFAGLSLCAAPSSSIVLTDSSNTYELDPYLELAEVSSNTAPSLSIDQLDFQHIDNWSSFDATKTYWGKITIDNQTNKKDWFLSLSKQFTHIDFYKLQKDSLQWLGQTGMFLPVSQRAHTTELIINFFHFVFPAQSKTTFLFKASCERINEPLHFRLNLIEESSYYQTTILQKRWNAFYKGIVIMFMSYGLFLFFYVRKSYYLYYALYLLGILLFNGYVTGELVSYLNHSFLASKPQYIYLSKLVAYLTFIAYIAFIRQFLQLKTLLPTWDTLTKWLGFLAIPCGIVQGYLLIQSNFSFNSDIILTSYIFLTTILSCFFLVALWPHRHLTKVWYIFYGTISLWIATALNLKEYIGYTVSFSLVFFQLGSILEFLFYSMGIAHSHYLILQKQQEATFALKKSQLQQQQQEQKVKQQQEFIGFKNKLYAQISYEFKTTLSAIKDLSQLDHLDSKDRNRILQNSDQLLTVITQSLDLSKLESKIFPLRLQQVDIIPLIQYWINPFNPTAKEKQQQVSVISEVDRVYLDTDIQLLEKIIINLVTNAIKYTRAGAPITISIKRDAQTLTIEMQDIGLGIPNKDITPIFKAANSTNTISDGLDLAIVKECTQLLGGSISVKNKVTTGTTFSLQFPIHQKQQLIQPQLPSQNNTQTRLLAENAYAPVATTSKGEQSQATILIIEDNHHIIYYYNRLLSGQFQLEVALNGVTGLKLATELMPDLIICDVMMPEMDGLEVCNALKKNTITNHLPIIMVTAKASDKDRIKGFQAGVDVYLRKPFNPKELLSHIQRLQDRKHLMHEWMEQLILAPAASAIAFPQEAIFQKENDFLQKINAYLDQYIGHTDIKIQDLASLFFIGERHFRRKLKTITNYSPTKYIRFYKVSKARGLLLNKEMTIVQIAEEVGFNNIEVFNRTFKEFYGITPSKMRQEIEAEKKETN